ncbi:hypothetical protein [Persephonella sp.]
MAVIDRNWKITKKDSKKIIEDVKNLLKTLGLDGKYDVEIRDITEKDSVIKPLYSVIIDVPKHIPEKKRVMIMESVDKYLEENYGYNISVSVITD